MVTPQEIDAVLATLEQASAVVVPLIRALPEARLTQRPAPEKWCALEHFCHLSTLHPMFTQRLDLMLAEEAPEIVPYFPDAEAEGGALLGIPLDAAIERYTRERAAFVARLRALPLSAWNRTARHGEYNQYSIFIMCRHIAMHDLLHGYRIEEILLARE